MKALIAEDESVLAGNIKHLLESDLFEGAFEEVATVDNGAAAIRLLSDRYDLLILDLKMPEVDGTQVIEALSQLRSHDRPSVILITAYPGAYETARLQIKMGVQALLQKPFELTTLLELVKELLDLRHKILHIDSRGLETHCKWGLVLGKSGVASIQVDGLLHFADSCQLAWDTRDFHTMSRKADVVSSMIGASGVLHANWNIQAKDLGFSLFQKLFVGQIAKSFISAGGMVLQPRDLRITFGCAREHLQLPFEFLNDGHDFLALSHPLKRLVTGVLTKRSTGFAGLLRELQEEQGKLRVLLIASNTSPPIPGVDEEIETVYEILRAALPPNRVSIDRLPTERATYDTVLSRLKSCPYHILHYAGHGHHDEENPGNSRLEFWESKGRKGERKPLTIETLKNTLRQQGHSLAFVYLSCCSSAAHSSERALLNSNFLGIADGLIHAGVPAVLGFRHPVTDTGARELARCFYSSLFQQWRMDTALFEARCKVAGDDPLLKVGDWLSPILIVQNA